MAPSVERRRGDWFDSRDTAFVVTLNGEVWKIGHVSKLGHRLGEDDEHHDGDDDDHETGGE